MRILCVISDLGSGGAQRQLVELSLGFKERGHDVFFLTYYQNIFFNSILEKNGIQITCIDESNYLKRLFKMRRFIRHGKYDAVLSFLTAASFICEIAGLPFRKWKLVVGERSANPNMFNSLKLKTYCFFHILADYVVANSYANLKSVRSINPFLADHKCKVIYNAVDFSKWYSPGDFTSRKSGKLKLIVASSHQYLKNLDGLVKAFALLTQVERSKISVDWYGDAADNSFQEAKRKIIEFQLQDVFSFYSATHEISKKIRGADLIGLFSFYEGLPNAVCEGMACGKPIICSTVSDVPSFLSHQSDLLCDPADPQSIRDAIRKVLDLNSEELINIGKQNRSCAENSFNKETIVSQYLKLLS